MRAAALIIIIFTCFRLSAQDADFASLYEQGRYEDALRIVNGELDSFYSTRLEDKRIPSDFISMKSDKEDINLNLIFRYRKAKGFFIEDNPKLANLHVSAAACHAALGRRREAISNYTQALRFKNVELGKDDAIYYALSQIYKKAGQFEGYIAALESAFTLNPERYAYSLELGISLAPTTRKTKALYHLERYMNNTDDDIDPSLYLTAGNLNEDLGYYLNTQDYYQKYLSVKTNDGVIHFALGYIAFAKTGSHRLAASSFARALELLPEADIYHRSKAHEYTADMALSDLQFQKAIDHYGETIKYQEQVLERIKSGDAKIKEISERINLRKAEVLKDQNYESFKEYESLEEEKGKLALELNKQRRQYEMLNCGTVRWNTAWAYERIEEYQSAIEFYRQSISFDYRSNDSREKIIKLQLKIKRGY